MKILQKSLLCLFILTFSSVITLQAQCPFGDVTFSSQTDIDNFPVNYPNCNSIQYDVGIHESVSGNITNLNGLNQLNLLAKNYH